MNRLWKLRSGLGLVTTLSGLMFTLMAQSAFAQAEVNLKIVQRWMGTGTSSEDPAATYEAYIASIELLTQPYESWTQAERDLISRAKYDEFWAMVSSVSESGRSGVCAGPVLSTFAGATLLDRSAGTVTAADIAASQHVAMTATFIKSVPAWNFVTNRVVSIVAYKTVQTVKNKKGQKIPKQVWVVHDYGVAYVNETVLCSREEASGGTIQTGGRVESKDYLLLGRLSLRQPGFLNTPLGGVFRIVNGSIHYPQVIEAFSRQPTSLQSFIATVATQ